MHVDVMRRIDVWCGVPICFLLTLWRRLVGDATAAPDRPRQVLFIQTAEMGSLVLALPAVRHMETAFPGCRVQFLVFSTLRSSVSAIGIVRDEDVLTIDPSSLFTVARDTVRFVREARRRRIDTVVNLEMFARFGAILTYLTGAARRAGFHGFGQPGVYCGDLLTHRVLYNPHVHTSTALLAIARALEEDVTDVPMGKLPPSGVPPVARIRSDAGRRRRILALVGQDRPLAAGARLIVINPNASQLIPIRRWPLESYAALVTLLVADPANVCVITGTEAERADARFIVQRARSDRVVDLSGRTSVADLLDLYDAADLLVTNDSGPAQLAALTAVHIMVFFGPETPALYRPLADPARCTVLYSNYWCSPCVSAFNQRKTPCTNNMCLKTIDVASVHAAATEILSRRQAVTPVQS